MINILFNEKYKSINIYNQEGGLIVTIFNFTDLTEYVKYLMMIKIQKTQFVKLLLLTLAKKI
jgi:hypothetical protein